LRGSREQDDERITNERFTTSSTAGGAYTQASSKGDATGGKAGEASRKSDCSAGTSFVPTVQARMGGHCGKDAQRAGHSFCLPVLSGIAPRSRTGSRVPQGAARAMD
jgi:hypothetical protein